MTLRTRTAALLAATLIAAGGAGASKEDGALDVRGSGDATGADPTFEDELDGFEDELDGFEDEEPFAEDSESAETDPEESDRFWELRGDVSLGSSINYRKHKSASGTQYRGLSRLRSELFLQLDIDLPWDWKLRGSGRGFYDFAYLIDRDDFTQRVLSDYEWEIESQEVWFQGPVLDDLDLKVGRQVVNW